MEFDSAVDDVGIQNTQITLFHCNFLSFYDKSTAPAVNIIQLHILVKMGWDGGIAGFPYNAYRIGF